MQKHKYNMGFCDYKTLNQFNTEIPYVGLVLYICKGMAGWQLTGAQVCPGMTNLLPDSHTEVATKALLCVKVIRKRRLTHIN